MYSSQHPAEHRFPVWWTGDVVYTMLLDNVHKMVNGGLELQPYVHPDCGAHYGVSVKCHYDLIEESWNFIIYLTLCH
jgi:hypothetical protein